MDALMTFVNTYGRRWVAVVRHHPGPLSGFTLNQICLKKMNMSEDLDRKVAFVLTCSQRFSKATLFEFLDIFDSDGRRKTKLNTNPYHSAEEPFRDGYELIRLQNTHTKVV